MATHSYIFHVEQQLIETTQSVLDTLSDYCYEKSMNENNRPHEQNDAPWCGLRLHVRALRDSCNRLLDEMDKDFVVKLR